MQKIAKTQPHLSVAISRMFIITVFSLNPQYELSAAHYSLYVANIDRIRILKATEMHLAIKMQEMLTE